MNALMMHVEQIVLPVRAYAPRKLRMRNELLAHLEAALHEERKACDTDDAALTRTKERLGEPAELTRDLQASVPWIEKTLMARLPVPPIEKLETRAIRWRADYPLTPLQASIWAFGVTILPFAGVMSLLPSMHLDRNASMRMMFERPLTCVVLNLGTILITLASVTVCSRFVVAIGRLSKPFRSMPTIGCAAAIVALPLATILLSLVCINRRSMTLLEMLRSILVGFAVLGSQFALGKLLATLRKPYAPWLALTVS